MRFLSQKKTDVVVIGGGAAGMMAAGTAAARGLQVVVVEPNAQLGRKLRMTGHGRCNITHACEIKEFLDHVPTNPKFLFSALTAFSPEAAIEFFHGIGLPLKTEKDGRVFPLCDSAEEAADRLGIWMTSQGVEVRQEKAVDILLHDGGGVVGVRTMEGSIISRAVILCAGGMSYPATGSSGDGFVLARRMGHTVTEPQASLVSILCRDRFCRDLAGLSLRGVALTVRAGSRTVYQGTGDMMFSHFGVTGPLILDASAYMRRVDACACRLAVDLKPTMDADALDQAVHECLGRFASRDFVNAVGCLGSKSLLAVLAAEADIAPGTKAGSVTRHQRQTFVTLVKNFPISPTGFRPLEDGMVTGGGVKVTEVDPRTMASKLVSGLYFAGEVLDVDACTGGFNLQIAWSTGHCAGMAVGKEWS